MNERSIAKRLLVCVAAAALVAVQAPSAQANHRPNFYCSSSGDLCQNTRTVDGQRKLGILLAARYFRVFHLCVTDPDGWEACVPFHVRDSGDGTFGRDVKWRRHFPNAGPGAYTVRWMVGGGRVGRVLGFHVL